MAVTVDTASATIAEVASGTSVVVPVPAGTVAGNVLAMSVEAGIGTALGALSGWQTAATVVGDAASSVALYYRVATSSEPASYTVSIGATAAKITGEMVRLLGVDNVSPLDTVAATASSAAQPLPAPKVTTITPGALVLYAVGVDAATATDVTLDPALTLIKDTTGTGKRLVTAYETVSTAGLTTQRNFTETGTTGLFAGMITAAFRVASPAGTFTKVAAASQNNTNLNDIPLTVPAGVTTSHLGVLIVTCANGTLGAGASIPGWTGRSLNAQQVGEYTMSSYLFTRLGGQKAGDVIAGTLPSNCTATVTAVWYDTGGRDVTSVGPEWNSATAGSQPDIATQTFTAPSYTGSHDVILASSWRSSSVLANPALASWSPTGPALDTIYGGSSSCGAFIAHATQITAQAFTSTWASSETSHDNATWQLVLAAVPGPKIATLTEDFTTKDTSKWWWQSTTAAVVSGGQYVSTPNSAYSGWTTSQATYDLTSSSYSVQLVQAPNVGNGTTECYVQLSVNATNNKLNFDVNNGTLGAYYKLATTGAVTTVGTVAYNAATMKYLRISHDGTKVHWHYSADGTTWTEIGTGWAPTFDITNLVADLGSGYYGTEPSPGTAIFDNVNLLQTALNKLLLGAGTVGLKVGSVAVDKAYIGSTQVWP